MKKFFIKDNMCVPFKLLLNRASAYLTANGWQSVNTADGADVYIVGGCANFHSLEEESFEIIKDAKKTKAEVVVFGCLPKVSPEKVGALEPSRVIPSTHWERLESLVENPVVPLSKITDANEFRLQEDYRLYDPGKKFVLLQTGCSSNCPYCPHKLGIGDLNSRPASEILRQIRGLAKEKVHTITLHGNDAGSYGTDFGTVTYPELLQKILEISPNLHLAQLNADWVYEYREVLFPLLLNQKIKEFQVLIQTVSDRLLRLMERRPVVKALYYYLKFLREKRKDIIFRTDIIIGYPTSTEDEEAETLEYVAELFDEVAVHGFERFTHARIEKMGLPFYPQEEIDRRAQNAVRYLKSFRKILIHRGGQVYQTLVEIEKPKEKMRRERK